MISSNDGKIDAASTPEPVPSNGLPNLTELALTTLPAPQETPSPFGEAVPPSLGMPFSTEDHPATGALHGGTEGEGKKQPQSQDMSLIYVDYSVPAVLRYSDTMAIYLTLREAIAAWLTLPNEIKKDASITAGENGDDSRFRGWEIYRLWGHWNS